MMEEGLLFSSLKEQLLYEIPENALHQIEEGGRTSDLDQRQVDTFCGLCQHIFTLFWSCGYAELVMRAICCDCLIQKVFTMSSLISMGPRVKNS
jgi:hypothetical protein